MWELEALLPKEKYQGLRQKLIYFFAHQNCADPEGLADESIYRFLSAAGKATIVDPDKFLFGIAKHVAHEYHRQPKPEQLPEGDPPENTHTTVLPDPLPGFDQQAEERNARCLQKCLQQFTPAQRQLLLDYYRGDGEGAQKRNRKDMAARLGIKPTDLTNRFLRLKRKLAELMAQCLKPPSAW